MPRERKSNLPLSKPLSLDDFVKLVAPRLPQSSPIAVLDKNPIQQKSTPPDIEWNSIDPKWELDPFGAHPLKPRIPDNTVGPVSKTSSYGSNMLPYSAARVPTLSTNVSMDTRKCEPHKTPREPPVLLYVGRVAST